MVQRRVEAARRRVRATEARVQRQREITAGLPPLSELGQISRRQLAEFEQTLRDHESHLEQVEEMLRLAAACYRGIAEFESAPVV